MDYGRRSLADDLQLANECLKVFCFCPVLVSYLTIDRTSRQWLVSRLVYTSLNVFYWNRKEERGVSTWVSPPLWTETHPSSGIDLETSPTMINWILR